MNVNNLVYVSCDPVTLARDIKLLKEKYDVVSIKPFNMFSKTYHVECVCLLKAK
jgi:23S rRNA (uracil1939-C5)-methyltransferase